ncbi:MAG: type III pantothenate kinase [Spirochaetota bacterium]
MILTIDAGNTNIAIGLFRDGELAFHWRLSTRTQRTPDEVLLHLRELMTFDAVDRNRIRTAVISSVVPAITHSIHDGVARLLGFEPIIVSPDLDLPITIATDDPAEVGSDLVANAVAGYTIAQGSSIVVDFGTALSFTAVDVSGALRGVALAPGLSTAENALVARTAALPMVDLSAPETYIGTNTPASLRSGLVNGFAGLVDRMVEGIAEELGSNGVLVLATGGEAALVAHRCRRVERVEQWLTLRGLLEIGLRNQST